MSMQLGSSAGIKSDINVTPLVDVMLALLPSCIDIVKTPTGS